MVKFRQKQYSTKTAKALRGVKKALNRADTSITNKSLDALEYLGISKRPPGSRKIRISPKSDIQINRETHQTIGKVQDTAAKTMMTPIGHGIDKGIEYAVENPISAVGNVTGKALMVAPGVSPVVRSLPIGGASIALEQGLKKKSLRYAKETAKLRRNYKGSPISKTLREVGGPTVMDLTKIIPVV